MNEQNTHILERIHASYYQLTVTERKVADFILSQPHEVQFMSITQLAEECGTAEATISRFCRTLELKGFNAFKLEIARYCAANAKAQQEMPTTNSSMGRILSVGRTANDAVYQTIELINPQQVERAVELMENANRVICIGAGGSMIMASEFAHLFSTISCKFQSVPDAHMQMSAAATMDQNDIIVLFSYSGATTSGLQILELARERGVRTILITRFHKSPAASMADVVLLCGSSEGPFQFGSIPAKVAQLIVMDVLFHEYYHRNAECCDQKIQAIASALSGMHV